VSCHRPWWWWWALIGVGGVWWWAIVGIDGGVVVGHHVAALLLRAVTVVRSSLLSIVIVSSPGFVVTMLCTVSPSSVGVVVMSCRHLLVGQVRWIGMEVLTNGRGRTTNVSSSKINVKDKWDDVVGRKKGGKKKELRKEDNST